MPDTSDFLAQFGATPHFDQGFLVDAGQVVAIDPGQRLAVLAVCARDDAEPARLAAEILLDDMKSNLGTVTQSDVDRESAAITCLRESLANIEEYLAEEGLGPVALAAVQVGERGDASLMLSGAIAAYLRKPGEHRLSPAMPIALAGDAAGEPLFLDLPAEGDSCLLLLPEPVDTAIGSDFIRLSLGRFCDTPEMLFRQLDIRGQRNGLKDPPCLLFARLREARKPARGWVGRLLHR